ACEEASSAQVHAALVEKHGLAPTTIATMLKKMDDKGVIKHRSEGRQFIYQPAVAEEDVRQTMVSELVGNVFRGDHAALVNHLLTEGDFGPNELAVLRARIEGAQREEGCSSV
ncbi:MAG: BlaI/MecI/CopY family transcriptional regulator, partial [Planctomycetota bacterium]|nr:BlaI/MecI/CopY family transcriptional regulator [Planctomycetota bacterium]